VSDEAHARALAQAGKLLARRAHARAELEEKLARHVPREVAGSVTAELERSGLLDDARFAAEMARHRLAQGYGPRRIAFDLAAAGVERDVADEALASLDADAIRVAERRAARGADPAQAARRLHARGFVLDDM
jgi:regulatory protein